MLVFPFQLLAQPAESIIVSIDNFACPSGTEYKICGGINAKLHNQFVSAMKKWNTLQASKYWDQMIQTKDWTATSSIENILPEPLFGTYQPEWVQLLPVNILAKKSYKWGILTIGNDCTSGCSFEDYSISFIKYKENGMIYIYNQPFAPKGSKQNITYSKLYGFDFSQFDIDITKWFQKWKFNNKDTNALYQSFLASIKDTAQKIVSRDYAISDTYRVKGGVVQHRSIMNGEGWNPWKYIWSDTDFDAATIALSSPENGKDKYGWFYGGIRLKMNENNVFFSPIGATKKLPSLYFQDGKTDDVYVMGYWFGPLQTLSWARISTLTVLDNSFIYKYDENQYDEYMNALKKACNAYWDDSSLFDISAVDKNYCYGTFGSAPGNLIQKKTERLR